MPRSSTSPQTNFGFADLSPELFARITQKLPAARLADFRLTCKQFAALGVKDATLVWINKHFPTTIQAALSEQQQGPMTFAQKKISDIDIMLTKEPRESLLPKQIMPSLLKLQRYELEPLYRDFKNINQRAHPYLWSEVKAILPQLSQIFLWIKTGNKSKLQEIEVKLTDFNVLWLLNNLDRNHLSAFDWAQISGNKEFLETLYRKSSKMLCLSVALGRELPGGLSEATYQSNILQLAIKSERTPQQLLKVVNETSLTSNISLTNSKQENSLHFAVRNVEPMWLLYLLKTQDRGSLLESLEQENTDGLTPLDVAAQVGNWRAVSLLATFGASILNLKRFLYERIDFDLREGKTTRFHVAAQCLSLKHFKKVLASDPYFDIETPDNNGSTLLHIACFRGNLALVKHLISLRTANYLLANDYGRTALHCAILGNHVKVITYLLAEIEDLSQIKPTREGWTLSHLVVKYGDAHVLRLFKAQIITELTARDENGDIPLALALKEGRHKQVHRILSILPPTQQVPVHCLHLAATSEDSSYFMQIVSRVVDIDIPDGNRNTPLHLAAGAGNVPAVLCLLSVNAVTNSRNDEEKLPEYYAKKSGNTMLACLFECLRYGKEMSKSIWVKKVTPKKANAARALENVLLGKAEYATLEPHMHLFSTKVSKSLSRFYKAFLPLIAPHLVEGEVVAQADTIASSSNPKI
ncbi:MAG: ankyrin repeat domain-containing protein [Legionella sp.]|uniref:ankyrin repeat domain-containing protein n=1 Tax=Legionella sp. TaxID=459 RepID=UPI002848A06E|nr:ankyrin repeat domain-containing protein [Legionella sp.]